MAIRALRLASVRAPWRSRVRRFSATLELVTDARALNDALRVRVLLTRVRAGTRSRRDTREVIVEQGARVLETEIPQREAIGLAGGSLVADPGPYTPLLAELHRELEEGGL